MQFSTKVRYASRAMIELALNYEDEPIQLHEIACKQDISVKYLEQIMAPLRAKGYVRTQKGSKGGYHLAVDPNKFTLYEIVESVEGSISPVACLDNNDCCNRSDQCVTRSVWGNVRDAMIRELKSKSLSELAAEQREIYEKEGSNC